MKKLMAAIAASLFLAALASPAEARSHKNNHQHKTQRVIRDVTPAYAANQQFSAKRHHYKTRQVSQRNYAEPMGSGYRGTQPIGTSRGHVTRQKHGNIRAAHKVRSAVSDAHGNSVAYVAGHRPAGCPHAWCGCGTSLYVFGRIVPSLNLAANWVRKFPAASPAPGMVAARSGHVKVITGGSPGNWQCYDPNSGGGAAHSGPCSLAGYHIVNPHGGSIAVASSDGGTRTYHGRSRGARYASVESSSAVGYTYLAH